MNAPESTSAEVFVMLLARHERMLAAYVMTLVPHFQDADDILQETKVVMWRCFSKFKEGTNFGAWARKIAFHQVLSHRKRKKRDRLDFSDEFLQAVAEEAESRADSAGRRQAALSHCLSRLPEEHQQLLHFRYGDQLSVEQLAERLSRTVAAVYRMLSRVRMNLHQCVTRSLQKPFTYEREFQPD